MLDSDQDQFKTFSHLARGEGAIRMRRPQCPRAVELFFAHCHDILEKNSENWCDLLTPTRPTCDGTLEAEDARTTRASILRGLRKCVSSGVTRR